MSFSDNLFWDSVSGEHERIQHTAALTHGKVSVAAYWPFLSSAFSERDFENRLSLSLNRIAALVDADVLDAVIESLRDDYRAVTGAKKGENPFAKDDDDSDKDDDKKSKKDKKDSDDDSDDDDDDSEDADDADDDDSDDDKDDNTPPWLKGKKDKKDDKKKESSQHTALGKFGPEHIDAYRAWAKKNGHNDDDLSTLKKYEKEPGVGRAQADHIADEYHGEDTDWRQTEKYRRQASYVPDPSNGQRYHQGYDALTQPVNNGDLQGPDGYIEDLAEGEQRTPEAYARQTTPGTWSQGQGMPERPMPQGVERGYHPVASYKDIDSKGCPDCGAKWSNGKLQHTKDCSGLKEFDPQHEPSDSPKKKQSVLRFDKEGFLIESVVDPVPGAPLASNPFFFGTGSEGLLGEGFPQEPSQDPADRANEFYGDQQPGQSSGSEEGYSDGKGYSRSHPGETVASRQSPNFNHQAGAASEFLNHIWDSEKSRRETRSHPAIQQANRQHAEDIEALHAHPANGDREMDQILAKRASTNGQIVDHCPGCDKPRRVHSTMHGDEIRHLHNDHVRCFGKSAGLEEAIPEAAEEVKGMGEDKSEGGDKSAGDGDNNWAMDVTKKMSSLPQFFDPHEASLSPYAHTSEAPWSFQDGAQYQVANFGLNQMFDSKTAGDYLGRPDANNPTGRGDDEFKARTWDAFQTTKPMQSAEDRNVNTPVKPAEPMRTRNVNSPNPGENLRDDKLEQSGTQDEEEED